MTIEEKLDSLERRMDLLVDVAHRLYDVQVAQENVVKQLREVILTIADSSTKHLSLTGNLADALGDLAKGTK